VADAREWWLVVKGPIDPSVDDAAFAAEAAALLPPVPWDDTTWKTWCDAVAARTGRRGKALFQPLRRALTGRDHGPEMRLLLPLIGFERARARLLGARA
jgi:glutamyl-tRNA synthetase